MGVFTREEEEVRIYDGDAFWYFMGTILLVILLPWTYFLAQQLLSPRPPPESDWDSVGRAPKHAKVRRCATSEMEAKRQAAKKAASAWRRRLRSNASGLQLVVVVALWVAFFGVINRISDAPENLSGFDPFVILDVPRDATPAQIKKAYRQKSLETHPDKNRDNPLAPALFQQITKAHAALTEESARLNFEKYGNPDGPVQSKVGIALHPAMLGSKERQLTTLVVFFAFLLLGPLLIVLCCLRGNNRPGGSVSNETIRVFNAIIDSEISVEDGPSLLAISQEAQACAAPAIILEKFGASEMQQLILAMAAVRPQPFGPNSLVEIRATSSQKEFRGKKGLLKRPMSPVSCEVLVGKEDKLPEKPEDGILKEFPFADLKPLEPRFYCMVSDRHVQRSTALIWSHLWRLHPQIPPLMKGELERLLQRAEGVGRAMVSIAACGRGDRSGCLGAVMGVMRFRQCLTQALDLGAPPLLQLPHVRSLPPPGRGYELLPQFREVVYDQDGAVDKLCKLLNLSAEQKLDIQAFCRHVPKVELDCQVEVYDEEEIAQGDLATMIVTLTRTNLEEGEFAGPVHSPFWPCPKFEEWWVLIHDRRSRRFVTADAVLGSGRKESCKLRFMVPRGGEFVWSVQAMCDSYVGLDVEKECTFKAAKKSEVDRSIYIHPADMNIRSFFEEVMEGLQPQAEDSESEEDVPATAPQPKAVEAPPAKKKKKAADESDSDDSSSDDDVPVAKSKAKAKPKAAPAMIKKPAADSDSESDKDEPDGVFVKIVASEPVPIFNGPDRGHEEPEQVGAMPPGNIVRGHVANRPEGWLELALSSGNAWVKLEEGKVEQLGPLLEQTLHMVISTVTPVWMLKRWMRNTAHEIMVDDLLAIRDMDNERIRVMIEELVRQHLGEDKYGELIAQTFERMNQRRERLTKCLGYYETGNNCIWHVTPAGRVTGLHPDGSRIQDKVNVSKEALKIGPTFTLDETKTCACLHWIRTDNPQATWNWNPDHSLESRVRIGTAF